MQKCEKFVNNYTDMPKKCIIMIACIDGPEITVNGRDLLIGGKDS
ncbi:hypothetical protein SAMN04487831_10842 [Pseudobutyrivibrio sp. UC1225]|nr:hypothetical protein [Pseudobutyrivibrio sp. UC1225]SFO10047.1 hypothetical protein SAMN04487831_10842 [Pseudobutyrivibrio sp. UC1225]